MAVAYALAVALGLLGAHRFYLGRIRSATAQLMLAFAAVASVVVLAGDPSALVVVAAPIAALGWWIADLFRTAGMVRGANRRAALQPGAPGYDRGWPEP